ncbi:nicotinate-nucleotide--dimethylbenzimidazole phosphoribosyltransferase [Streptomyces sp. NBC_00687]|uniref:nicotinate-nucleotide--dimethylbenzimidazole phosphoribosyltransferase n=1 Tax=Streptomyces sp. NBC_00687 TaxID=2975807 RepID=UPI0022548B70|nr:nicotinate-nucleotide--dimethylbenzimidazole phosphoribosyltransferase [Streptomyces sp. NBC_00687]MCX4913577.1 nicotinate-nucleotide--dimethylbenzimidazole phosphoribosyltransferase [Streptomyces sp. NBC_00687]
MTDTGQVPGEGMPESAGMVEQPGVAAPGAYTYLDPSVSPAEDDDLLLLPGAPGAQGAWGNEVPPPAPMPFVPEPGPHEPGPHETAGRDTGSVDLGAVRAVGQVPAPQPVPPRRPLHLGPPTPDGSSSPVRSLADRGPAGSRPGSMAAPVTPMRHAGPPTVGPEYLDVPPAGDTSPQGAVPWGAPQPGPEAPAAETVVPEPAVIPETVFPETVLPGTAPDAEAHDDAGAGQQPEFPAAPFDHGQEAEPAQAPEPQAAEAALDLQDDEPQDVGPQHVDPLDIAQAQAPMEGPAPEAAPAADVPSAPQVSDAPQFPDTPLTLGAPDSVQTAEQPVPTDTDPALYATDAPAQGDAEAVVAEPYPAPVEEPVAEQAPQETGEQDVYEAQPAGFAEQNGHLPDPAAPFAEEAPLADVEQPPAQHTFDASESALSALTAHTDGSHGRPVDGLDDFRAQQFTEPAAFVDASFTSNGTALPVDGAFAPGGIAFAEDAAPHAPHGVPVGVAAHAASHPAQGHPHGEQHHQDLSAAPGFAGAAPESSADHSFGQFVPVEGQVPTTPHLAPTPPHAMVVPPLPVEEEQPPVQEPEFVAAPVPAQEPAGEPVDVDAEPFAQAAVPAPREAETAPGETAEPGPLDVEPEPVSAQLADDLDTRVADQEESTAAVEDVRESSGPAAPGYDDAEREAVLRVMRERRDIRNGFRSDPIPHDVLLRVLEAAHTAPSVGHSQPWDFVVIRSADTRRSMHELAQRQREAYAKSLPKGRAKQFKELKIEAILDTPVNIVVTADPTRGGRHTLGRHTQPQMAPYSSALAVENLWLAARAEGLGVGWVSFFDEREMVRALGLPDHLEVVAYLCVGYVDEFPDEPELMQAGWSKRRPLSWVVHEETYGRRALPGEEPHDLLAETVSNIRPLDAKALGEAWERQKRMTKPAGALGMLEIISAQLSGLSRMCPPPIPEPAAVAIFAGDHGVHAQGVTPWPQEVTGQMVANFLGGGAVCNAFANQVGAEVCVIDVGVASDLPATPGLLPRKVRAGTADMTTGPAMTREEVVAALEVGIETARDLVAAGNKALLTGEMGIANTTASAALIAVYTGADPSEVTGRGTGINDETLARKTEVVRRAVELHQPDPADPIGVLAAVGGLEHAAMVGLLLGGASLRTPVILDGVSAGAAALVARAIAPEVLAACIAGHRSAEPGHVAALNKLGLRPLIDLDLRLGEGTGALLALPVVQSAARAMHEVATFDSAGVTEK